MTETSIDTADITGKTLKSVEAWQTGHFILTSGKHSSEYMQCQKVMQYPRLGNLLADLLIEKVESAGLKPETVVGPALGAIHWELYVAQALERHLCKDNKKACDTTSSAEQLQHLADHGAEIRADKSLVKAVFAEKIPEDPGFAIRRGIELKPGEKILVVEDVTTTGGSARKVVEMLKSMECDPVAVGAVVDRSGGKASFDVPFINLLALDLETYEPDACPLCVQGSVAIKPGSTIK